GGGQHIEVSHLGAALQFLGPELLAYELDRRVATRAGNRHRDLAPHGVFPCLPEPEGAPRSHDGGSGAEGWVAISCADDEQWRSLVALTGLPQEASWATAAGRRSDEDRIEELLASWTARRRGRDIVAQLQPHVACAPVLGVPELHT